MTELEPSAPRRRGASGTAVVGAVLIVLGLIFLAGQQFNLDVAHLGWPFYVIAPGVALLAFGLTQHNGSGLSIAGSIVTIVGLLLFYQNAFDHWESWAYVWPFVGPGGSGMGMLLYGTRSGNAKMARDGFRQIVIALALFAAGFVFFEGVLNISGDRLPLPGWVMPVVVIILGVAVLARGLLSGRRATGWPSDADDDTPREGAA